MRKYSILMLCTVLFFLATGIKKVNGDDKFSLYASSTFCFIENKGQVTDQEGNPRNDIDFRLSAGSGLNIFTGSGHIHYQWSKVAENEIDDTSPGPLRSARRDDHTDMYRMDVVLVGANSQARVIRENRESYYEQYFLPQHGEQGVRAHAWKKIIYKDIYPHIDWVLYLNSAGKLEYDFIVHPGGRVADIKLRYDGAVSIQVNDDGSLTATTPFGRVTEQTPYSFQSDGTEVKSRFILRGKDVSFATDAYQGMLTIDPTLEWATYYGGTGGDESRSVTLDEYGNVYIAGYVQSANMATVNSHQQTPGGGRDAFLAKFDSQGQRLWATYYGGTGADVAYKVMYDAFSGALYLAGETGSGSGIATGGSHQSVFSAGGADGFLVKFDTAGTRIWGTYYGGTGYDYGYALASDHSGNIYMAGFAESTAGIATTVSHQPQHGGGDADAFLVKFDSAGTRQWATYYGAGGWDDALAVSCDAVGNVYMSGFTESPTHANIAVPGSHQAVFGGNSDAFLVKFDSTGARRWSTYYGGTASDVGYAVRCDDASNVYMAGSASSTAGIATPGSHQAVFGGTVGSDAFLAKFDSSGTRMWATYYGGTGNDHGRGIACAGADIYFAGWSNSPNVNQVIATPGALQDTVTGNFDLMLVKFDSSGARQWGTYYGGPGRDEVHAMSYNNLTGDIYVTGYTTSDANIATQGSFQELRGGGNDGFLVKFWECPVLMAPAAIFGNDTVCINSEQLYYVPPVPGATSYTWTFPSGWSGNSTSDSLLLSVGKGSSGAIRITVNSSCDTSDEQSLDVYVRPFDPVSITVDSFVLGTTDAYHAYQWYLNGSAIDHATDAVYTVTENGNYTVKVTDIYGCMDSSDAYTVTNVAVPVLSDGSSRSLAYPNPAGNLIYVDAGMPASVAIYSMEGKLVMESAHAGRIDISRLVAGVYILHIQDKERRMLKIEKLVKAE